jgi:predicted DCC family thiol-disulfide oxidoreductase YuxK
MIQIPFAVIDRKKVVRGKALCFSRQCCDLLGSGVVIILNCYPLAGEGEKIFMDYPLIIIDGHCAWCTRGIRVLMALDRKGKLHIAPVQSKTGRDIYAGFGKDPEHFDTYIIVVGGRVYERTDAYIETMRQLGGMWRVFTVLRFIPKAVREAVYDWVERNRIKWFGTTGYCELIPEKYRERIVE